MRTMILMSVCACIVACVAPAGGEDGEREPQVSYTDDQELAEVGGEAPAASFAACHGTTTCPGGVFISGPINIACGAPYCSNQACGKTGDFTVKKQPHEVYRSYAMPGGTVCLAYQPATAGNAGCSCSGL